MLAASSWRVAVNAGADSTGRLMQHLRALEATRTALLERMPEATLHSLHAAPVTNLPPDTALPRVAGERAVAFSRSPGAEAYVEEVAISVEDLAGSVEALVVSLGYDTAAGDPHGGWGFGPEVFAAIGYLLADAEVPVCVVQEGGYSLPTLAECSHAFAIGLLDESPKAERRGAAAETRQGEAETRQGEVLL